MKPSRAQTAVLLGDRERHPRRFPGARYSGWLLTTVAAAGFPVDRNERTYSPS